MTARSAARDIASPGPPVPVVGVGGDGEGLKGLEAIGAINDVVVARFGRDAWVRELLPPARLLFLASRGESNVRWRAGPSWYFKKSDRRH